METNGNLVKKKSKPRTRYCRTHSRGKQQNSVPRCPLRLASRPPKERSNELRTSRRDGQRPLDEGRKKGRKEEEERRRRRNVSNGGITKKRAKEKEIVMRRRTEAIRILPSTMVRSLVSEAMERDKRGNSVRPLS